MNSCVVRRVYGSCNTTSTFDILLTVHLSIILVINRLNAQNLVFIIRLLYSSTCFEHCCAHHQEVKIVLYSIWYHHTCRWPSHAEQSKYIDTRTYLLTPWCRVLLEKLTGLQLVKKFPAFHGTPRFITTLTSVRHLSLSWV